MLSSPEITRYSRNILLSEVGRKGQEKLKESIVTVVGAGGLGSPVLYYLAAAGVGEIRIIDSNIKIVTYNERLTASNIVKIFSGSNLILEGSDNFETKFLVNDACHFLKIPLIIAGILRFEGQVIGVIPNTTACYRCIFQSPPDAESVPNCAEAGVIGSVAGLVGSIQATESIKYLLGIDQGLFGSILSIDTKSMEFRKIQVLKNKICPLCGDNPSITQIEDIVIPHCDWV